MRAAEQDHAPRVLREALALARLEHPHICRYYTAWLQTDWRSLQTALQTKGSGPGQVAVSSMPPNPIPNANPNPNPNPNRSPNRNPNPTGTRTGTRALTRTLTLTPTLNN